jgi:putative zinc finger protein
MHDHDAHVPDEHLLAAAEGELSPRQCAAIERHVASCATCAARADFLLRTAGEVGAAIRSEREPQPLDDARRRLQAALRRERVPRRPMSRRAVAAAVALAAMALAVVWLQPTGAGRSDGDLSSRPLAALTPGAAAIMSADMLCADAHTGDVPVPAAMRAQVIASYGMQNVPEEEYELDYLITPELGGAVDARNLWPQRYAAVPWNAFVKDELERLLPRLVCSGRLDLQVAQRDMAADWIAAYRKYFRTTGPLRTHVRNQREDDDIPGSALGILPRDYAVRTVRARFTP